MKRLTWTLLRLVTEAKGHSVKEMSFRLREKFPQMEGLSTSSFHEKADEGKEAPPEVAKFVAGDSTKVRPGYEVAAKVARMGVAAWRGKPSPAMGKRLDALGSKLDNANGKLDNANGKLDNAYGKLHSNGEKLDTLLTEVAAIRTVLKGALHVTATVLLIVGLGFAGHQLRADVSSGETTNATQVPPVSDAAKAATRTRFNFRVFLGAMLDLDLGKRTEENWVPKEALPGQKLAKDCKASLGEEAINGGCWFGSSAVKPPCGELFRHGDTCYRPVAADPTKPVGLVRAVPGQQ